MNRPFKIQKFERKTSLGIILASVGFEAIGLLRYESISKTCERTRFYVLTQVASINYLTEPQCYFITTV